MSQSVRMVKTSWEIYAKMCCQVGQWRRLIFPEVLTYSCEMFSHSCVLPFLLKLIKSLTVPLEWIRGVLCVSEFQHLCERPRSAYGQVPWPDAMNLHDQNGPYHSWNEKNVQLNFAKRRSRLIVGNNNQKYFCKHVNMPHSKY